LNLNNLRIKTDKVFPGRYIIKDRKKELNAIFTMDHVLSLDRGTGT